jgi:hypothetical protein
MQQPKEATVKSVAKQMTMEGEQEQGGWWIASGWRTDAPDGSKTMASREENPKQVRRSFLTFWPLDICPS